MKKCILRTTLALLTLIALNPLATAAPRTIRTTGGFSSASTTFSGTKFKRKNFSTFSGSGFTGGFKPPVFVKNKINIDINVFVKNFGSGFGRGRTGFVGGSGGVIRSGGVGFGGGESAYFGFVQAGVIALQAGKFSTAVAAFDRALGVRPGDTTALRGKQLALSAILP